MNWIEYTYDLRVAPDHQFIEKCVRAQFFHNGLDYQLEARASSWESALELALKMAESVRLYGTVNAARMGLIARHSFTPLPDFALFAPQHPEFPYWKQRGADDEVMVRDPFDRIDMMED